MSGSFDSDVNKATDAINEGRFAEALSIVDAILAVDPNDPDANLMRGIALSQTSRPDEASASFVKAVTLSPKSVKARYNAAVHEYNVGRVGLAQQLVQEALTIDPAHKGSQDLLNRILPKPVEAPTFQTSPGQPGAPYAQGYGDANAPGIPFITNLGPAWVAIGTALIVIAFLCFAFTNYIIFTSEAFSKALANPGNIKDVMENSSKLSQSVPGWISTIDIVNRLALLLWMILDLNHRRGQFLWILPQVLCGCVGCGWIVAPLYLLLGRKS